MDNRDKKEILVSDSGRPEYLLAGHVPEWLDRIRSGDFAYRIMKDGTAAFDWFWDPHDENNPHDPEILEIPETVQEYPVVRILSSVYDRYININKIIIPDSVREFEKNPFACCPNLEKIIVSPLHPSALVEDGLLISREKKQIICCPPARQGKVSGIPDRIISVGPDAFMYSRIEAIDLPASIREIGDGAFSNCSELKEIRIPEGIRFVENYAFNECSSLQQVTLPEGVERIGDMAFASCQDLYSIRLPDSVEEFGCYSFLACENLVEINIPQSLKNIDLPPFMQCGKLKNIHIPAGQETYELAGNLLINRPQREVVCCIEGIREEVNIPDGMKSIGAFAFNRISWIRNIDIPEGIENIEDSAFSDCKELRSVHLPSTVTKLGDCLFIGSHKMKHLNLPKNIRLFEALSVFQTGYLTVKVDRNSPARDYCRRNGIPYRYPKTKKRK